MRWETSRRRRGRREKEEKDFSTRRRRISQLTRGLGRVFNKGDGRVAAVEGGNCPGPAAAVVVEVEAVRLLEDWLSAALDAREGVCAVDL